MYEVRFQIVFISQEFIIIKVVAILCERLAINEKIMFLKSSTLMKTKLTDHNYDLVSDRFLACRRVVKFFLITVLSRLSIKRIVVKWPAKMLNNINHMDIICRQLINEIWLVFPAILSMIGYIMWQPIEYV